MEFLFVKFGHVLNSYVDSFLHSFRSLFLALFHALSCNRDYTFVLPHQLKHRFLVGTPARLYNIIMPQRIHAVQILYK